MRPRSLSAPEDCKVYTPAPLAGAMARLLADRPSASWLEPCVGRGVFLDALGEAGVDPGRVTAVELDAHDGLGRKCGSYLPATDFFAWAMASGARFDRVIGNPPYLPLHRLPPSVRAAALRVPRPSAGTVPPKANAWYAFVCAALRLLRPGGGVCFVLPSAWEYADYAADLRDRVYAKFGRVVVHRSDASVFPGVLDGCVILAADEYGTDNRCLVRRNYRDGAELLAALKERPEPDGRAVQTAKPLQSPGRAALVRFADLARVRIGGVTGDASYFLMSESRRLELGLPRACLVPVVTRARHLAAGVLRPRHWSALLGAGERVWLFRPGRMTAHPRAVDEYLASGRERGVPNRQKVRAREPWFRTRLPPHPDAVVSGMTPHGPWLSLVEMPRLTATNTLYTVHFRTRLSLAWRAAWALALLTNEVATQHGTLGRRYSDGLLKFEPRDVMNLSVPTPAKAPFGAIGAYRGAVAALLAGDTKEARRLADEYVSGR